MSYLFTAPREFFDSEFLPMVCIVTGEKWESVKRIEMEPKLRANSILPTSRPWVKLPLSPRGLVIWEGVSVRAIGWFAGAAVVILVLAVAISTPPLGVLGVLGVMLLGVLFEYFRQRRAATVFPLPPVYWAELPGKVCIEFPPNGAERFHVFNEALTDFYQKYPEVLNPAAGSDAEDDAWADKVTPGWDQPNP